MKEKIHIIQFAPYSLPHIGGVENVVEEIFLKWTHGKSLIFSGNKSQQDVVYNENKESIIDNTCKILFPSIEIIDNFPFPRLWTKTFWKQILQLKKQMGESQEKYYIITHTRFFFTSLMGGLFACYYKLRWIHIEHGSDYPKLSTSFKTYIAYFYDRTIGKWIFKNADTVLSISEASKGWGEREFGRKDTYVWYRGLEDDIFSSGGTKIEEICFIYIGRLVSLKGVSDLLKAFSDSKIEKKLYIIGDGPERTSLEQQSHSLDMKNIIFLGLQSKEYIKRFLSTHNCILVNPSYSEGLPTTVLEGLATKNIVIATDVGGTKEISSEIDLILFPAGDIQKLTEKILLAYEKYFEYTGKSYTHIRETFSRKKSIEDLYNLLDICPKK